MESTWVNLAIQIPLVVAFILFALETQRRFQLSMDKRDEAYLKALTDLTCTLQEHDKQAALIKEKVETIDKKLSK